MESHKKILGILFIVLAVFQTMLMLLLGTFLTSIFTFAMNQTDPNDAQVIGFVMDFVRFLPALIILFLALPALIAGIGLLTQKSWAMIVALIIACLNIFSFPLGTALGIYTIWIYSEDNKLKKAQSEVKPS